MNLSEHFTLAEYTASETAARRGINNKPVESFVLQNLHRSAAVMEEIRIILGVAVIITSGYRCLDLNTLIGSKRTSAHVVGLGTDFIAPKFGVPYDVCRAIEPHVARLEIDQLIYEHTWVHIGLATGIGRRQVMTLASGGRYVNGIVLQGSM